MATGPMPYDDDKMPIYALGMNIGLQISQQVRAVRLFAPEVTNYRLLMLFSHPSHLYYLIMLSRVRLISKLFSKTMNLTFS